MTHYEQLWEFPSQKALKQGAQDMEHAQRPAHPLSANAVISPRCGRFISPMKTFSETQRVQAFSAALAGLHKRFPTT